MPLTQRIYTSSEDGLYGPAVDRNFATNKWVYLFYSPQTVVDVKLSDGSIVTQTTPNEAVPNFSADPKAWDKYLGYFQLSRFKFVEDASGARLDLNSEQQILKVPMNRQECCHVAGDIDVDKHNNLWLVTGDDTPAGGINAGGYGPFNDQLTDEQQTVRVTNATGGTFTLTFNGQTIAPIAYNANNAAIDAALEALSNIEVDEIQATGAGTGQHGQHHRVLPSRQVPDRPAADHGRRHRPHRHGRDGGHRGRDREQRRRRPDARQRRHVPAPDRRRSPLDAEHERPARQAAAVQGQGRRHHRR